MPKKVKKKVNKKQRTTTKQGVNVKIQIDQSKRTNPRQQNANRNAPRRLYPSNATTPLHTTIMTATPSPTIMQKEPNYAEAVNNLFQDAIMKTNRQLNQLTDAVEKKDLQINQLVQRTQFPPTNQLYNLLMNEHQSRFSQKQGDLEEIDDDGVNIKPPQSFADPNAKIQSSLQTPQTQPAIKQSTPVAKRTRVSKQNQSNPSEPLKPRGRPRKIQLQKVPENDYSVPDLT